MNTTESVHGNIGHAMGNLTVLKAITKHAQGLAEAKRAEMLKHIEEAFGKLNRCTAIEWERSRPAEAEPRTHEGGSALYVFLDDEGKRCGQRVSE